MTSSRQQSKTTRFKGDVAASLPPSGPRGLKGVRQISSSSPNMYGEDLSKSLTASSTARGRLMIPSGGRTTPSLIPTPKGGLSRPMSTTPGSGPSTLKGHKGKRVIPPRSASVGPEKLACQLYSRSNGGSPGARQVAVSVSRPGSARFIHIYLVYYGVGLVTLYPFNQWCVYAYPPKMGVAFLS